MPQEFPQQYGQNGCTLVPMDSALLPYVAGALERLTERQYWATDDDHRRGYNAVAELYICMANNCLNELIEAQNRIYRLLDTQFNGTIYQLIVGQNGPEIDPPITMVPSPPLRSIHSRLERLEYILDNAYNGGVYPDFTNSESLRDLLRELITEIKQAGPLDDDILAKLAELAVLLA